MGVGILGESETSHWSTASSVKQISGATLSGNVPGGIKSHILKPLSCPTWKPVHDSKGYQVLIRSFICPAVRNCPFCENYAKFYFDAKHLQKGLNRCW